MLKSVTEYIERIKAKGTSNETYGEEEISTAIASLFKQMVLSDGVIRDELGRSLLVGIKFNVAMQLIEILQ